MKTASTASPIGPRIGSLRIAKVTYDHHPIYASPDGKSTIGQLVDDHIAETIQSGAMISSVSLNFETEMEQFQLRDLYMAANTAKIDRY